MMTEPLCSVSSQTARFYHGAMLGGDIQLHLQLAEWRCGRAFLTGAILTVAHSRIHCAITNAAAERGAKVP